MHNRSTHSIYPSIATFGVEPLLTEEDDPVLWEAVLRQHWAGEPRKYLERTALYFDIVAGDAAQPSQLVPLEQWNLIPLGNGRWKAERVTPTGSAPAVGLSLVPRKGKGIPYRQLGITRPSRGVDQALVYAAFLAAPRLGSGGTKRWTKRKHRLWRWLPVTWRSEDWETMGWWIS